MKFVIPGNGNLKTKGPLREVPVNNHFNIPANRNSISRIPVYGNLFLLLEIEKTTIRATEYNVSSKKIRRKNDVTMGSIADGCKNFTNSKC